MYNRSLSIFSILTIFAILAILTTISGCNLFNGTNDSITAIQANTATMPSGTANVTFSIKAPEGQNASIRSDGKVIPTVVVTLTVINTGSETETTWTLKKTAQVINSSATVNFASVPAKSCIAAFSIANGNIGGATEFHGSKDLTDGSNDITVVPVGSGDAADNTVEMVKRLISNPSAIKKAGKSFIKEVNDKVKLIDFTQSLAFEKTFNEIINTLKPDGLVSISIDSTKNKFIGMEDTNNLWSIDKSILKPSDFDNKGFETSVIATGVFKVGIGNTATIYFEDKTNKAAAVVNINSQTGARKAALSVQGNVSHYLELPDNSIILAGINGNSPFVLNWDGITDVPLATDTTTTGVKWFKTYTGNNIPDGISINKLVNFGAKVLLEMKLNATQINETFNPSTGPDKTLTTYPSISSTISGIAVDPYLEGTEFFYDLNDDQKYQANEPLSTPTNANGEFFITGVITNAHDLMAKSGSLGTHLGKAFPFKLRTNTDLKDGNGKVIASPITSVVEYGLDISKLLSVVNTEFNNASITTRLTENDITVDPLAGLEIPNVTELEDSDLLKIRAVIAIQQYLSVIKQLEKDADEYDYAITSADFEDNKEVLAALAQIVKNACNVEFIRTSAATINSAVETIATKVQSDSRGMVILSEAEKETIRNAIQIKAIDVAKTCVSIANYCSSELVKAIKLNGKNAIDDAFITALTTKTSTILVPEIGPRYYFQRVRATLETPPTITGKNLMGNDIDKMIWDGIKANLKFSGPNTTAIDLQTVVDFGNFKGIEVAEDGASLIGLN